MEPRKIREGARGFFLAECIEVMGPSSNIVGEICIAENDRHPDSVNITPRSKYFEVIEGKEVDTNSPLCLYNPAKWRVLTVFDNNGLEKFFKLMDSLDAFYKSAADSSFDAVTSIISDVISSEKRRSKPEVEIETKA